MAQPAENDNGPSQGSLPWFPEPYRRALPRDRHKISQDDGDVVLAFDLPTADTSRPKELIVSGKILSEASEIFKEVLASSGPEAEVPRSVEHPHILIIGDWRKYLGLLMLCHALHGVDSELDQRDDLGSLKLLLEFAKAAKGWCMVEYLKTTISPGLLAPFAQRPSERDDRSFRTDTDLATIAWMLEQEHLFSLFTRRLLMDHCVPLSECTGDFFKVIPTKAICESTHVPKHSEPC